MPRRIVCADPVRARVDPRDDGRRRRRPRRPRAPAAIPSALDVDRRDAPAGRGIDAARRVSSGLMRPDRARADGDVAVAPLNVATPASPVLSGSLTVWVTSAVLGIDPGDADACSWRARRRRRCRPRAPPRRPRCRSARRRGSNVLTAFGLRVDARDGPVLGVEDPDGSLADGDVARGGRGLDERAIPASAGSMRGDPVADRRAASRLAAASSARRSPRRSSPASTSSPAARIAAAADAAPGTARGGGAAGPPMPSASRGRLDQLGAARVALVAAPSRAPCRSTGSSAG